MTMKLNRDTRGGMNTPELIILLSCVAGAVIVMQGAGINAHLGGGTQTGLEGDVADLEGDIESVQSDQRGVDSIIGLAITSVSLAFGLVELLLLAPVAMQNAGFPAWLAGALSLPIYAMLTLFIVGILRGIGVLQ